MNYTLDFYNLQKRPGQNLAVVQCGYQRCKKNYSSQLKPYPDYSVTFILKGKGRYTIDDVTYELKAGQGFMIPPGIPVIYCADAEDPWSYIYAIVCGMDRETLFRNCGLNIKNPVFHFNLSDTMQSTLHSMFNASRENRALGYDVTGYFLLVMSQIVNQAVSEKKIANTSEEYIEQALAYIETHYPYQVTVNDLAKYINIDRTYLYKIFMQHIHISPTQFLTEYRLFKAAKLMENPDNSLQEIAMLTGFCSASHFSRAFAAKYGISPGKYRKNQNTP